MGRSEIDYDSVADYLYGTTQFTFCVDRKSGKEAGAHGRGQGVILVNPTARNLFSENQSLKINEVVFK
jgi:hypothetical protein